MARECEHLVQEVLQQQKVLDKLQKLQDQDDVHDMAKDSRLTKHNLDRFNQCKRTPKHPTKSHIVVAKEGNKIKTIRFGQQGVTGDRKNTERSQSFKARHRKNIQKGKMSAAYWADKCKW